jgi:monoamine oxidase
MHWRGERQARSSSMPATTRLHKIAWQSRRFWEQENNIYGGLSFLQQTVECCPPFSGLPAQSVATAISD